MTRRALEWLLVAVAASLVSCGGGGGTPTEVVLLIDIPPPFRGRSDLHVDLTVKGAAAGAATFTQIAYRQTDITGATWPYQVAIAPQNGDATRKWHADMIVTSAGVSQAYAGSIEGGYVDGKIERWDLCLQACSDPTCTTPPPGSSMPNGELDPNNIPASLNCTDTSPLCGNGLADPGEQCDDGNTMNGDGCSSTCQLENPALCGNGTVDPGEQCDDGNTMSGDGCSSTCQFEPSPLCGNGNLDPGEQCDDGNTMSGDGCSSTCQIEYFCAPPQGAAPALTANLSCLGSPRPAGAQQTYNMQFTDLDNNLLMMPCVAVYPMGNLPPMPVCNMAPGAAFLATLTANTKFSYVVESAITPTIYYTLGVGPVPSSTTVTITARAVSTDEVNSWSSMGVNRQPNTALAVIQVLDCQGKPIAGARVRVITKSTNLQCIQEGDGGTQYVYLDSTNLPAPGATATTDAGLALVTNLPDTGAPGLVEVWAPVQGMWRVIACDTIPLRAGDATVATLLPLDDSTGVCPDQP